MNEKTAAAPSASQSMNILDIWNIFWPHRLLIIILALVAATASFIKVQYFTPDVYSASGILFVRNRTEYERALINDSAANVSDIGASSSMTTMYIEILKTRDFYEDVSAAVGGLYSPGQIKNMFTITNRNGTPLLDVRVTCNSAENVVTVANAILAEAPNKLGDVFDGGEVKVVEWAIPPSGPQGKGKSRLVMIGFLTGLALGCLIAWLLHFMDNKIHRSEDVSKGYGISILGEISQ